MFPKLKEVTCVKSFEKTRHHTFDEDCFEGVEGTLEKLEIQLSQTEFLPKALGTLTALKSLKLDMEKLKELPDCFESMKSLTELDVSGCGELTTLPPSLGTCPISSFGFRRSGLQGLPETAKDNWRLDELTISHKVRKQRTVTGLTLSTGQGLSGHAYPQAALQG